MSHGVGYCRLVSVNLYVLVMNLGCANLRPPSDSAVILEANTNVPCIAAAARVNENATIEQRLYERLPAPVVAASPAIEGSRGRSPPEDKKRPEPRALAR